MSSLGRDGAGDLNGGMAPLLLRSHDHERVSLAPRTGVLVCADVPVLFQDLQDSAATRPGAAAEPFYIYACGGVR
jgi:hypothetical protein